MNGNNQESGRTMMEMIGVIAIIGVLTVGAVSTVNYGLESFRVSSAFNLVESTANNVSDLYSWRRELPTDKSSMRSKICLNKVFDDPCVEGQENATIATAWGYLTVAPKSDKQFQITLTNVPYMACSQLVAMKWTNVERDETVTCSDEENGKTDLIFYGN